MPGNDKADGTDASNMGAELKKDKNRLLRENGKLRRKLDAAMDDKLAFSTDNARLDEKVVRLEGDVARLENDVQSLQGMKEHRENAMLALTVLCGTAPLFFLHWFPSIVFGLLILGILCWVLCIKYYSWKA